MDDRQQDEAPGDVIQQPEPAHVHEEQYHSDSDLEATELRPVTPVEHDLKRPPRLSRLITPEKPLVRWYDPIKRFWRHQIRISVPHVDCRDHLGKSTPGLRRSAEHRVRLGQDDGLGMAGLRWSLASLD